MRHSVSSHNLARSIAYKNMGVEEDPKVNEKWRLNSREKKPNRKGLHISGGLFLSKKGPFGSPNRKARISLMSNSNYLNFSNINIHENDVPSLAKIGQVKFSVGKIRNKRSCMNVLGPVLPVKLMGNLWAPGFRIGKLSRWAGGARQVRNVNRTLSFAKPTGQ
jgi:hypothetical protein